MKEEKAEEIYYYLAICTNCVSTFDCATLQKLLMEQTYLAKVKKIKMLKQKLSKKTNLEDTHFLD